jgi:N-acetylmuramoyl-L-alanine amidase
VGISRILQGRLNGLRVAVDVQHVYKLDVPEDRGARFVLANGTHLWEAQAATVYAQALAAWLAARGAVVLTNDPRKGDLTGSYPRRNRQAGAFGAHAYLACHLNAGGGKYAALEYPAGYSGAILARTIGAQLVNDFKEVIPVHKEVPLTAGQRGWVCVGGVPTAVAAVLLEPFFGDYRPAQMLLDPQRLSMVGESIATGLAAWWESQR